VRLPPTWFAGSDTNEPRSLRITPRGCAHIAVVRHGCPSCGPMDRHPVASSKFNRGRVAAKFRLGVIANANSRVRQTDREDGEQNHPIGASFGLALPRSTLQLPPLHSSGL
jgi:hypothetical protein